MNQAAPAPVGYIETVAKSVPAFAAALDLQAKGQMSQARATYVDLMDLPQLVPACLHQLGVMAGQRGDHQRAAGLFRQAVRLEPDQALFYHNLATTLERLGRIPETIDVLTDLAARLQAAGRHEQALPIYGRILTVDPCRYAALVNMGMGQAVGGNPAAAVPVLTRGLALAARAIPELANFLRKILPDMIAAGLVTADLIDPPGPATGPVDKVSQAVINLGKALSEMGLVDLSEDAYRLAMTMEPGLPLAHWNLAVSLLARQEFDEGWEQYEWRMWWDGFSERTRSLGAPPWRGESLTGKRIGIWGEQGNGDIIQFVPLVQRLLDLGPDRVVLEVPVPLVRLFQNSVAAPRLEVIARTDDMHVFKSPEPVDYILPMMSLPGLLKLKPDQVPLAVDYMKPLAADRAVWAERFDALPGRRVGLVWSGRENFVGNARRLIPVEKLAPLFAVPDVSFVSLQVGPRAGQAGAAGFKIFDAAPYLGDFADTAAALSELDLIVSVDTGVAHLASAIGRPVWIMVQHVPDWRWYREGEDCPWYPSARLFRQKILGDWSPVVEAVANALRQL
jgi:Flp pilus assembly protein TadD